MKSRYEKLAIAISKDRDIIIPRSKIQESLGSDFCWLVHLGLTKGDLIKLERDGRAIKARYSAKDGHRVRWLIFEE